MVALRHDRDSKGERNGLRALGEIFAERRQTRGTEFHNLVFKAVERLNFGAHLVARAGRKLVVVPMKTSLCRPYRIVVENQIVEIAIRQYAELLIASLRQPQRSQCENENDALSHHGPDYIGHWPPQPQPRWDGRFHLSSERSSLVLPIPVLATILIFAATYLVMAIGRLPGFRVDRTGAAIIGASLMLAANTLTVEEAYREINYDTIILLFGMMIVVANLRLSGFFTLVSAWVVEHAHRPLVLLSSVVLVSRLFSAFLR